MSETIKLPSHLAGEWKWVVGEIKRGDRFMLSSGDLASIPEADVGALTEGPHMGMMKKPVGYVRAK